MILQNVQCVLLNMAEKITSCDCRNGSKNYEDLKGTAMIWVDEIIWMWRKWISG
jgi:hypothetical protein